MRLRQGLDWRQVLLSIVSRPPRVLDGCAWVLWARVLLMFEADLHLCAHAHIHLPHPTPTRTRAHRFITMLGQAGGATCNSSFDCGGVTPASALEHDIMNGLTPNATSVARGSEAPRGSCTMGRCVCQPGMLGARCNHAAHYMLQVGGGACNQSAQCTAKLANGGMCVTPRPLSVTSE